MFSPKRLRIASLVAAAVAIVLLFVAHAVPGPDAIELELLRPQDSMVVVRATTTTVEVATTTVESPKLVRSVALIGDSTAYNVATALKEHLNEAGIAYAWAANPGCAFTEPDVEIYMDLNAGPGYTTCPDWRETFAEAAQADVVILLADGTPLANMGVDGNIVSLEDEIGRAYLQEALDYIDSVVEGEFVAIAPTPLTWGGFDPEEVVINRVERTDIWNEMLEDTADRVLDITEWTYTRRHDGAHIASEYRNEYAQCILDMVLSGVSECSPKEVEQTTLG